MSLPPARPTPLAPGLKLDRYELLCPIAEGGMASVWIARHSGKHGFEKFVAVKTVLAKFAADARFQQMFQDEARIASRIEHAHVAQILDVGEQHDITYLVMEYVDGESLSTVHRALTKKSIQIPPGVTLRVMADICGGLHCAHELRENDGQLLGVVHRDVSPQNVLVSTRGVAKLIDFGIAKARDRVAGDTNAGQVKGKIRYMAPEQALGSPVDRRADIWAVGAIVYHLLSGKPPYDGENDVQALMMLTSGRPPPALPSSVHPAIAEVVKRSLTASVDGRYSTAADLQQALEDAMAEAGVETKPAAVAAFLSEHVAERTKKRKEAIAIGVEAAAERERYAEIMRSNVKVTGGLSSTVMPSVAMAPDESHSGRASRAGGSNPAVSTGSRGTTGSNSGASSRPGVGSNPPPSHSVVTGGTLGSAAMDVGLGGPLRGRTFALAGAAAGGVLAAAALVHLFTREPTGQHAKPVPQERAAAASPASPPPAAAASTAAVNVEPSAAMAPTPDANVATWETMVIASGLRPAPLVTPPAQPNAAATPGPPLRPAFRPAPKPGHVRTRVDDGF